VLDGVTHVDADRSVLRVFVEQQVGGASERERTSLQALLERVKK
jgi:hypothetical protein